jgi:hypothetical protein
MVALYAAPWVPAARDVVEIVGAGATMICSETDLLVSTTDVAVTVAVVLLVTLLGAV